MCTTNRNIYPMKVLIVGGGSGMLSNSIGSFLKRFGYFVAVIGRSTPSTFVPDIFIKKDLLKEDIYATEVVDFDVIIYAAGAGVQAAVSVEADIIYAMNLQVPIKLSLLLNKCNYQGVFVSFGSYMEIGCNNELYKLFNENDLIYSTLPVPNDYVLSKRLFTHYINDANFIFKNYHFILPNLFARTETGTRLVPYISNYLKEKKRGCDVTSPRFSSGSQVRQYVFIEEVIWVIVKCIEQTVASGVYNIGGGEIATIREFITGMFISFNEKVDEQMFGKEIRRDNDILSLSLDNTKLLKAINFSPKVRITDIYHE